MQILDGTLAVEVIRGNRGDFCVGTLITSIGEFKVKDAALEQFDRGSYKGRFTIEKIYIDNARWRNGWFTNLMAKIAPDGYQIDEEDQNTAPAPSEQAEPDPIDDSKVAPKSDDPVLPKAVKPEVPESKSIVATNQANQAKQEQAEVDPDIKLFGIELYPLFKARAASIALDNTIDREQFRMQRDRLKANAYKFDPKSQQWYLSN